MKHTREYWLSQTWSKLHLDPNQDLPDAWTHGSVSKFRVFCECGRAIYPFFGALTKGNTKSCGKCTWGSKEYWLNQRWYELRLDPDASYPEEWAPASNKKFQFICDCGLSVVLGFASVTNGNSRSCGKCFWKQKEHFLGMKWDKLRLDPNQSLPDQWSPWTPQTMTFICDCERSISASFKNVSSGNSTTCGMCEYRSKEFWLKQTWGRLKLNPDQLLPMEWGTGYTNKMEFLCSCNNQISITAKDVLYGDNTQSCGCIKPGMSELSPAYSIFSLVRTYAPDAVFSYWFKEESTRMEYDIYVPSKKLAIEHHGLIWHSYKYRGKGDFEKYKTTLTRGDRLVQIYADEWRNKRSIMEAMLKSLLQPNEGKRIKPIFEIQFETSDEVKKFLNEHHYLGTA